MLIWEILFFILLLFISAYFSSVETALTSQTRLGIKQLIETQNISEYKLKSWMDNPSRLLTTILVANNLAAILASVDSTLIALRLSQHLLWSESWTLFVITCFASITLIVFGEIIPKIFAKQNSTKVAILFIGPLEVVATLLDPLIGIILWFANRCIRLLGGPQSSKIPFLTTDDLRSYINIGAQEGVLKEDEKRMIHSIFQLSDLKVKEAMVPKTEMVCLDITLPSEQLIDLAIQSGYSRLPVYKGSVDHIIGLIYTKDMLGLLNNKDLVIMQDLVRPPFFVQESKKVSELLKEFQAGKMQVAIVVDKNGKTVGLISLEDVIEEIIGEIRDEYDLEEKQIELSADGSHIVDARMNIADINRRLRLKLPLSEDVQTLAGLINQIAGRAPEQGQEIEVDNVVMEILKGDQRRVSSVKMTVKNKK